MTFPVSIRCYTEYTDDTTRRYTSNIKRRNTAYSYVLVFDTETTVDAAQELRFGFYQLYHNDKLISAGVFYSTLALSPDELATVKRFAETHNLECMPVAKFITDIFLTFCYDKKGLCVGLNLPFDLSRLAIKHNNLYTPQWRGGFSFRLVDNNYKPRIHIKNLNSRASLIQFSFPANPQQRTGAHRGKFCDIRTLAGALLSGSWSLARLAKQLQTEHQKLDTDEHGATLTEDYLLYGYTDVITTHECFKSLETLYNNCHLNTPIYKIYSEASLGKAYLRTMNIKPFTELNDFPPELLGKIMATYYGGRSEVKKRREIVPVIYCDFLSMYPTVCTLLGLWKYVTAQRIEYIDTTAHIKEFLNDITVTDILHPDTWKYDELHTICEVLPNDDIFPLRAKYGKDIAQTIGVNYVTAENSMFYTIQDCIASKLLTGKTPNIVQAYTFIPVGEQDDLTPIQILGKDEYTINPYYDDFYKRLIELRANVKQKMKSANNTDDIARYKTDQNALKFCANATSYGIFVELNVVEYPTPQKITVYSGNKSYTAYSKSIEKHGKYFNPIIATLITSSARLLLAIFERLIIDAGLSWAYCDTDSMAVTYTGEFEQAFEKVQHILQRFEPLCPYNFTTKESVVKVEDENYSDKKLTQLFAFCISAKRVALFNIVNDEIIMRKHSYHGLGHLLFPCKGWEKNFWLSMINNVYKHEYNEFDIPSHDQPAISRYNAATPTLIAWYKNYNTDLPYHRQVKPFNFLMTLHSKKGSPVCTFTTDLSQCAGMAFDRNTGEKFDESLLLTYQDLLTVYPFHPEYKFQHGRYMDYGDTQRRHCTVEILHHIGKESNKIDEQVSLGVALETNINYGYTSHIDLKDEILHVGIPEIARLSGMQYSHIQRIITHNIEPKEETLLKLIHAISQAKKDPDVYYPRFADMISIIKSNLSTFSLRDIATFTGLDQSLLCKLVQQKRPVSREHLHTIEQLAIICGYPIDKSQE